jgi:hypothetical protein
MNQSSKIETFWQDYLSTLSEADRKNAPAYLVDDFADTPEAAQSSVRDGIKTTTAYSVTMEQREESTAHHSAKLWWPAGHRSGNGRFCSCHFLNPPESEPQ